MKESEISRHNFIKSDIEVKLTHIFDELRYIRSEQVITDKNKKLSQVTHTTNQQTELLKTLAYKSIYTEDRSRRNNHILRGIKEKNHENCVDTIFTFIDSNLSIPPRQINIERAHRLGARVTQIDRLL